jgi:hypothetical protein
MSTAEMLSPATRKKRKVAVAEAEPNDDDPLEINIRKVVMADSASIIELFTVSV